MWSFKESTFSFSLFTDSKRVKLKKMFSKSILETVYTNSISSFEERSYIFNNCINIYFLQDDVLMIFFLVKAPFAKWESRHDYMLVLTELNLQILNLFSSSLLHIGESSQTLRERKGNFNRKKKKTEQKQIGVWINISDIRRRNLIKIDRNVRRITTIL